MDLIKYRNMLIKIKEYGYHFVSYQHSQGKNNCILRHDIDFDLHAAKTIAEINNEEGITAFFFIMIDTENYNCLTERNLELVDEIISNNQKIGLHFDAGKYSQDELSWGLKGELAIFDSIYKNSGSSVISLHRPGPFLDNNNQKFPGIIHTYEDRFFKEINYISDSGNSCPDSKINNVLSTEESFQLLIHPVWWAYEGNTANDKINSLLSCTNNIQKKYISKNCKVYK